MKCCILCYSVFIRVRAVDLVIYTNIKSNFNDLTDTEKVSLGETSLSLN